MNYVEQTIDRINGILLDKGCGLYEHELIDIGYIISNAIMAGRLDSSIVADAETWINKHSNNE